MSDPCISGAALLLLKHPPSLHPLALAPTLESPFQDLLTQGVALPASLAGIVTLVAAVPGYWLLVLR